jgi:hypothetical protein
MRWILGVFLFLCSLGICLGSYANLPTTTTTPTAETEPHPVQVSGNAAKTYRD